MWLLQYACHDVILYDRNEGLRISKGKIFTKAMVSHFFSITEHAVQCCCYCVFTVDVLLGANGSLYGWTWVTYLYMERYLFSGSQGLPTKANMGQLNSTDVSAWTSWQDILLWVMLYG
jgi:hypothetical protein